MVSEVISKWKQEYHSSIALKLNNTKYSAKQTDQWQKHFTMMKNFKPFLAFIINIELALIFRQIWSL